MFRLSSGMVGKHYLAERIMALMPPHLHYVEPYCVELPFSWHAIQIETGSATERRPTFVVASEAINDIDGCLTNFWRCLQDPRAFEQSRRRVDATPFSEVEWNDAADC